MTTTVLQWATGTTGRMSLAAVIDADDLELVGVRVYDRDKAGRDAGELADRPSTGIRATDDRDEALAIDADVVLYMGRVEVDEEGCFRDVVDLLAAGRDVVATGSSFIDVRAFDPERARAVEAACREGSSSFLGLGLYPGYIGESVVPVLSRLSYGYGRITIRESLSYAEYPSPELIAMMGYGKPDDPSAGQAPSLAGAVFGATVHVMAKALGLDVLSIEELRETAITETDIQSAAGVIAAGTVGAIKVGVSADCGPVTLVVEHVTWMGPDVAPDWSRTEGYSIEFEGSPPIRCTILLGTSTDDRTDMGCLATAMHAVHAIPAVRAASPGLLDLADMPVFTGGFR